MHGLVGTLPQSLWANVRALSDLLWSESREDETLAEDSVRVGERPEA